VSVFIEVSNSVKTFFQSEIKTAIFISPQKILNSPKHYRFGSNSLDQIKILHNKLNIKYMNVSYLHAFFIVRWIAHQQKVASEICSSL